MINSSKKLMIAVYMCTIHIKKLNDVIDETANVSNFIASAVKTDMNDRAFYGLSTEWKKLTSKSSIK